MTVMFRPLKSTAEGGDSSEGDEDNCVTGSLMPTGQSHYRANLVSLPGCLRLFLLAAQDYAGVFQHTTSESDTRNGAQVARLGPPRLLRRQSDRWLGLRLGPRPMRGERRLASKVPV